MEAVVVFVGKVVMLEQCCLLVVSKQGKVKGLVIASLQLAIQQHREDVHLDTDKSK